MSYRGMPIDDYTKDGVPDLQSKRGSAHYLGDLTLASSEKLTNQKHSNAQLCPNMFHDDFVILSL